jgi:dTDP-4-dehydrorhamnose 3,5-epimerase
MKINTFHIEGLILFEPRIFNDDRGFFYESFNSLKYEEHLGKNIHFVQDNISSSKKGVLRGLHFQKPPYAQGKLVTVIKGSVLDVAVDIRKESETYGRHQIVELSEENKHQFWIPPGFAHGFLALQDDTIFAYKCTNYYSPAHEDTIKWNDPDLNIDWEFNHPLVSEKDKIGKDFSNFVSPF